MQLSVWHCKQCAVHVQTSLAKISEGPLRNPFAHCDMKVPALAALLVCLNSVGEWLTLSLLMTVGMPEHECHVGSSAEFFCRCNQGGALIVCGLVAAVLGCKCVCMYHTKFGGLKVDTEASCWRACLKSQHASKPCTCVGISP